jgi:heme exporter protein B
MSVSTDSLLAVDSLRLMRGRQQLAAQLSFTLPRGCYAEVRGPNGSGKTTLLRVLAGLQSSAIDAAQLSARLTGKVFYFGQQSGFRPELSVIDQFSHSLKMYGADASPAVLRQRLARIGLANRADLPVRRLSQGQVRRMMLAVMQASGRELWLVDEPLNALDAEATRLLEELMREHLCGGGSILIATHRALAEVMPSIATHCAGELRLEQGQGTWHGQAEPGAKHATIATRATPATITTPAFAPRATAAHSTAFRSWLLMLKRETSIAAARPQDLLWPSVFHCMVVTLFPFGLGTEPELLRRVAAGVFWVSVFFAILIAASRMLETDFEQGALEQLQSAGVSLPALVAAKFLSAWVFVGLPLSLVSVVLGIQYGLPSEALAILAVSLALGSLALTGMSCLFSCLGLLARQAQVVVSLLAIPAFVPVLIFGSAAVDSVQSALSPAAPLIVLGGLALCVLFAVPPTAAKVLDLALE